MARLTWADSSPVNPANLNLMAQDLDLQRTASTFQSTTGRTITHNLGHQLYNVMVIPTADPGGYLGEVYLTKADNTVVIYNSGSALGAFEYLITPHA